MLGLVVPVAQVPASQPYFDERKIHFYFRDIPVCWNIFSFSNKSLLTRKICFSKFHKTLNNRDRRFKVADSKLPLIHV